MTAAWRQSIATLFASSEQIKEEVNLNSEAGKLNVEVEYEVELQRTVERVILREPRRQCPLRWFF